ncbi:UDP-forming cellulose synthase catalytic subunit [Pandoraea pulmonicola]|uniref:Cellulose synthase catalytic subunit [UDP-forming] n=1 Tax=Pandoraea pulmonicola TaxID=93221 RepID=A0AAJ5D340_PANPU|nr:UDP-forming cellulose synthase catalytic subunit [Pandoraea pulmonicola]AJC22472.1 cellulose synthase catalytic subunit (UDP-forming) [Pandoraea pulmonicola]SUA93379.1 Cellulose synthase catalytic subunit [UDP-forming] [Pandoraea pulmonicola]
MIGDALRSLYRLGQALLALRLRVPPRPDGRAPGVVQWVLAATLRSPRHQLWMRQTGNHVLARLAMRLDVRQFDMWREWWLRLFFQPARSGRPDPVGRAFAWINERATHRLGVPADAGFWQMVRALFWRTADQRPSFPPYVAWLAFREYNERVRQWLVQTLFGIPPDTPAELAHRFDRRLEHVMHWRLTSTVVALLGLVGVFWIVTTPFTPFDQLLFSICTLTLALVFRRLDSQYSVLVLIGLSLISTIRYVWWRLTQSLSFDTLPEALVGYLLVGAEMYTWLILLFGYIQTVWPLQRRITPLPPDAREWPSVDVYIPTYNEGLDVVRPTVYAACGIDWPPEKLNIYLLDDGCREAMREFAALAGVHYLTRPDNRHAKAGNINHALGKTQGEFVAIFDCDHIPVRSFLQTTMGAFLKDPRCSIVQTPHHFFSDDPFERNLATRGAVPNEGRLFYGIVQDGNDFWNASFFCGSCAVLRRAALDEIGGVAIETVTEDAHTALKLHRRGWNTVYLKVVQAAGLATESLSSHVGQRIRWARGMAQIFRIDNPLFGRGLTFGQRICYANGMLHFFYGIPRIVFLLAPICYLFFGLHIVQAAALSICAYVLPHIAHANIANSRIQGKYRHSFWSDVYEAVLAWYVALPTTVAFVNPRYGKFNVTTKGGLIEQSFFDWSISKPYLVLLGFNVAGFLAGILRFFYGPAHEGGALAFNLAWVAFNLSVLGSAVAVATEVRQVRRTHRVSVRMPATLYLPDGRTLACHTRDFSGGGLALHLPVSVELTPGTEAHVALARGGSEYGFPVSVVGARAQEVYLAFRPLTAEQDKHLVQFTFGRADAWRDWDAERARDEPIKALFDMLAMGLRGYQVLANYLLGKLVARWQSRLRGARQAQR